MPKRAAAAALESDNFKFRDNIDDHWMDLATAAKIRLPQRATPLTTGPMEAWLKKLGISNPAYLEYTGGQNRKQFVAANPKWTLRAWVGVLLEALHHRMLTSSKEPLSAS